MNRIEKLVERLCEMPAVFATVSGETIRVSYRAKRRDYIMISNKGEVEVIGRVPVAEDIKAVVAEYFTADDTIEEAAVEAANVSLSEVLSTEFQCVPEGLGNAPSLMLRKYQVVKREEDYVEIIYSFVNETNHPAYLGVKKASFEYDAEDGWYLYEVKSAEESDFFDEPSVVVKLSETTAEQADMIRREIQIEDFQPSVTTDVYAIILDDCIYDTRVFDPYDQYPTIWKGNGGWSNWTHEFCCDRSLLQEAGFSPAQVAEIDAVGSF